MDVTETRRREAVIIITRRMGMATARNQIIIAYTARSMDIVGENVDQGKKTTLIGSQNLMEIATITMEVIGTKIMGEDVATTMIEVEKDIEVRRENDAAVDLENVEVPENDAEVDPEAEVTDGTETIPQTDDERMTEEVE